MINSKQVGEERAAGADEREGDGLLKKYVFSPYGAGQDEDPAPGKKPEAAGAGAGHRKGKPRVLRTNVSAGIGLAQLLSKARPGDVVEAESGARHEKLSAKNTSRVEIRGSAGRWEIDGLDLTGCEDLRFVEAWIGVGKAGAPCSEGIEDMMGVARTALSLVDSVAVFERCVARVESPQEQENEKRGEKTGHVVLEGGRKGEVATEEPMATARGEPMGFAITMSGSSLSWSGAIGTAERPCDLVMLGNSSVVRFSTTNFFGRARVGSDSVLKADASSLVFMQTQSAEGLAEGLRVDGRSEARMVDCAVELRGCKAVVLEGSQWSMEGGTLADTGNREQGASVEIEDGSAVDVAGSEWSSSGKRLDEMVGVGKAGRVSVRGGVYKAARGFARLSGGAAGVFEKVAFAVEGRVGPMWSVDGASTLEASLMSVPGWALDAGAGSVSSLSRCSFDGAPAPEAALGAPGLVATLSGAQSQWDDCVFAMDGAGVVMTLDAGSLVMVKGGRCSGVEAFAQTILSTLEISHAELAQDPNSAMPLIKGVDSKVIMERVAMNPSRQADSELMLQRCELSTTRVDWSKAGRCPVHMLGGRWESKGDIPGRARKRMGMLSQGADSNLPDEAFAPEADGLEIKTDVAAGVGLGEALREARSGDVVLVESGLAHGELDLRWRHGIKIKSAAEKGKRFSVKSLRLEGSVDIEIEDARIGEGLDPEKGHGMWISQSQLRLVGSVLVSGTAPNKYSAWVGSGSQVVSSRCEFGSKEAPADLFLGGRSSWSGEESSWSGQMFLEAKSVLDWVGGSMAVLEDKKQVWKASGGAVARLAQVAVHLDDDYMKIEGEGTSIEFDRCVVLATLSEGKTANVPVWLLDKARLIAKGGSWSTKGLGKSSMIFCDREAEADIDGGSVAHEGPVLHVKNKSKARVRLDKIDREGHSQFAFLSKHGASLVLSKTDLRIGSQGYAGQGGEIEFEECSIQPAKTGLTCVVKAEDGGVARWTRCTFKNSHEPLGHFVDAVGRFEHCEGESVAQWMTSSGEKGSTLSALDCSMTQARGVKAALVGVKKGTLSLRRVALVTGGGSEADVVGDGVDIESQQGDYVRAGQPVFSLSKGSLKSTADRFDKSAGRVVLLLDGASSNLPQGLDEKALGEVEARLAALPGLASFKGFLSGVISQARVAMARKKPVDFPLRVVLEGPSGSGKAIAAELLGKAAHACGAIGGGQLQIIDDVVMDDLAQRGSRGKPLLLRKPMTHRILDGQSARSLAVDGGSTLVMISAGAEELADFETKFPSVAAAFKTRVRFEASTESDLLAMFEAQANAEGFELGEGAAAKAGSYMKKLAGAAQGGAKNGWAFRMAWSMAKEAHARRIAAERGGKAWSQVEGLDLMSKEDIPEHGEGVSAKSVDSLMGELEAMTGLAEVKNVVAKFVALTQANKRRGVAGTAGNLHLVFSGNPGTGKTTVARLMGDLYRELGLLPSGHVVETDRSGLVGEYIGHTAARTKALAEKAMGGVLFIDEAYALTRDTTSGRDFGAEAVDTLIKIMEDKRRDFAVVMAGYPDLMDAFLASNPGLRSRVGKVVRFDDYGLGELMEMLAALCAKEGFSMGAGVESAARLWISSRKKDVGRAIGFFNQKEAAWGADQSSKAPGQRLAAKQAAASNFGNAREIRKLFDDMLEAQAQRLAGDHAADPWEFVSIDVPLEDQSEG